MRVRWADKGRGEPRSEGIVCEYVRMCVCVCVRICDCVYVCVLYDRCSWWLAGLSTLAVWAQCQALRWLWYSRTANHNNRCPLVQATTNERDSQQLAPVAQPPSNNNKTNKQTKTARTAIHLEHSPNRRTYSNPHTEHAQNTNKSSNRTQTQYTQ